MPIVTWTRPLPVKVPWVVNQYGTRLSGSDIAATGSQQTTSYRSIVKNDPNGTRSKELEYNALSGPELARNIGKEYRQRFDTGNEFQTTKTVHILGGCTNAHLWSWNGNPLRRPQDFREYWGWVIPYLNEYGLTDFPVSHDQIMADGREAIRRTLPTRPEVSLFNMIAELRDGLPRVYGSAFWRNPSAQAFGDEYLNSKFGLEAFASDVRNLALATRRAHKIVRDFQRGSGMISRAKTTLYRNVVTREFTPPTVLSLSSSRANVGHPVHQDFVSSVGTTRVQDVITSSAYFAGAYTYHLSDEAGHSFLSRLDWYARQADKVLGYAPNVKNVYDAVPWSWLVGWFSDFNTFVTNVTALSSDSLVLRYGYIMHTVEVHRHITTTGITYKNNCGGPASLNADVVYTYKNRTRATPYGFDIDLNSLTNTQWAVLGALGLSRAPGHLRRRS